MINILWIKWDYKIHIKNNYGNKTKYEQVSYYGVPFYSENK